MHTYPNRRERRGCDWVSCRTAASAVMACPGRCRFSGGHIVCIERGCTSIEQPCGSGVSFLCDI
jgi:hypothetical protein